jgi:NTP pyrophosphatase (non-canonical NTP hydrolase)
MTNLEYMQIVRSYIGDREILEQLAEEAAELAQAALKCIRAMDGAKNPTPVSLEEARRNLEEEYMDVDLAYVMAVQPEFEKYGRDLSETLYHTQVEKLRRWAGRVAGKEAD